MACDLKGSVSVSEMQRIDALEDRVDDLADRMGDVERNYKDLRESQANMREAQIRLETYVRESFKRSEEQDQRQLNAVNKLDIRYEQMEKSNQQRHDDMITRVNQGVQESIKAVGSSNPIWVTGTLALCAAVGGILVGAGVAIAIAHGWI